jgi:hypothetical protein
MEALASYLFICHAHKLVLRHSGKGPGLATGPAYGWELFWEQEQVGISNRNRTGARKSTRIKEYWTRRNIAGIKIIERIINRRGTRKRTRTGSGNNNKTGTRNREGIRNRSWKGTGQELGSGPG